MVLEILVSGQLAPWLWPAVKLNMAVEVYGGGGRQKAEREGQGEGREGDQGSTIPWENTFPPTNPNVLKVSTNS
jgi:hypothetical protein